MKILSQDSKFRNFIGIKVSKKSNLIELYFDDLNFLILTENHEIWNLDKSEYVKASSFKLGDSILTKSGNAKLIYKCKHPHSRFVYDPINIEETHNFFANDILVHQCLMLDEFGFVQNDVEFFTSTYPVISSGKNTKIIIISTPNGMNLFYKLFSEAEKGKNNFTALKTMWNEHPDRDETWKTEILNNISEREFLQEFACVHGNTDVTVRINNEVKTMKIEDLYEEIYKDEDIVEKSAKQRKESLRNLSQKNINGKLVKQVR